MMNDSRQSRYAFVYTRLTSFKSKYYGGNSGTKSKPLKFYQIIMLNT